MRQREDEEEALRRQLALERGGAGAKDMVELPSNGAASE